MNKEEIYDAIESLSHSQGFYERLLNHLNDEILSELEAQNFKDVVDLVMYIEG